MGERIERILHLDASQRKTGSVSRDLSSLLVEKLTTKYPSASVVRRDLADGVPLVDDGWIDANGTPEAERTKEQRRALAQSDALIDELRDTDLWVIGTPVYNFSLPPVLKAWVDQICRARVTFAYSEQGPRGLLEDRKVFLAIASGGSRIGSPTEFLTPYLLHVLKFIGIESVEIVAADQLLMEREDKIARAREQVDTLVAEL